MRKYLVTVLVLIVTFVMPASAAEISPAPAKKHCNHKCKFKRDRHKLRKATDRNPIPSSTVSCESGGSYRALNPSSAAGGKYQILPSTWRAYLSRSYTRLRTIRLAEGRPRMKRHEVPLAHRATPLLQDIIAATIWREDGPGAWSCS